MRSSSFAASIASPTSSSCFACGCCSPAGGPSSAAFRMLSHPFLSRSTAPALDIDL
eukprot:CAMPEP_0180138748 /NCGR_PEP_ID=MMETSP0986-20121125/13090_1 /TAXON_ID=697907 /ORGANISM="non described non described, Strain CCMP2293" /LENGTH=55 /DNA_ID=CAMNT_0022080655 /DNA_START=413 /DNA_END=577 /DNA_ORIENTATION=-